MNEGLTGLERHESEWVINDRTVIFEWTNPLKPVSQYSFIYLLL